MNTAVHTSQNGAKTTSHFIAVHRQKRNLLKWFLLFAGVVTLSAVALRNEAGNEKADASQPPQTESSIHSAVPDELDSLHEKWMLPAKTN